MRKTFAILIGTLFLLSMVASAVEAEYTYSFGQRFGDRWELWMSKITMNEERQVKVLDRILERRALHLQSHPDDLGEVVKYNKDVDRLERVSPSVEAVQKHLGVLNEVKVKLEAKNVSTSGVENAIENAHKLVAKKNETKEN
jgi:hypothetical protein